MMATRHQPEAQAKDRACCSRVGGLCELSLQQPREQHVSSAIVPIGYILLDEQPFEGFERGGDVEADTEIGDRPIFLKTAAIIDLVDYLSHFMLAHQRGLDLNRIRSKIAIRFFSMWSDEVIFLPVEKATPNMLDQSIPLPSINDPAELQQRTAYCQRWMRWNTEPYFEWYCDGRTLRISHETDDEIEEYNLVDDLRYYETFPACIEDWAVAIAKRIVDESKISLGENEREEVQKAVADALAASPITIRQLIGTGVIESNYFGLLTDEGFDILGEELRDRYS